MFDGVMLAPGGAVSNASSDLEYRLSYTETYMLV